MLHQKLYLARSDPLHYKQILNRNLTDWSKLEFCYPWRNLQHGWAKWLSLRNQVDLWGSLLTHNHWMKLFSERITSFVMPNLSNARVFSKRDVKQAYWHVQLDKESSLLTTMIAPLGRYRWARLPFGLNVNSKIFQRKQNEALSGLNGVICVADDLLVIASVDKKSWLWSWAELPYLAEEVHRKQHKVERWEVCPKADAGQIHGSPDHQCRSTGLPVQSRSYTKQASSHWCTWGEEIVWNDPILIKVHPKPSWWFTTHKRADKKRCWVELVTQRSISESETEDYRDSPACLF